MSDEPQPPMSARDSRKQAKSDLAAAKSRSKAERPIWKKPLVWVGGIILVIIIAAVGGSGGTEDLASDPGDTQTQGDQAEDEQDQAEEEAADQAEEEADPEPDPEPEMTSGEQNALRAAENYLDMTPFSRKGLIEQLEFEDYSTEDATFAADNVDVNWREQAAKAAENYLELTPFSRSGLVEQLMFEGYTRKQAEYGVDQAM